MITVTFQAAEQIRQSAQQSQMKETRLRIAAQMDAKGAIEYAMGFDDRADGDAEVESNGVTILIAPGSVELLTGATLDFVEIHPGEARYIFINPNDPAHAPPKPAG